MKRCLVFGVLCIESIMSLTNTLRGKIAWYRTVDTTSFRIFHGWCGFSIVLRVNTDGIQTRRV